MRDRHAALPYGESYGRRGQPRDNLRYHDSQLLQSSGQLFLYSQALTE